MDVDGKCQGTWTLWDSNGQICEERTFDVGTEYGTHTLWQDGRKVSETSFKHGLPHGLDTRGKKSSEYTFVHGRFVRECISSEEGQLPSVTSHSA
jgi:antitoxin component YwqK of YwqJK toxin-antitoxin module